jgi:thymidylate kinase
MPWIILEGPDGGGKSSLAHELFKRFEVNGYSDIRALHYGPPKSYDANSPLTRQQQAANELFAPLRDYDPEHTAVICDRFHWGSPVYGPLFRPETNDREYGDLGPDMFAQIETWLAYLGVVTTLVMPSLDVITARVTRRGDAYLDPDPDKRRKQLERICTRYTKLTVRCKTYYPPVLELTEYTNTGPAADSLVNMSILMTEIALRSRALRHSPPPVPFFDPLAA